MQTQTAERIATNAQILSEHKATALQTLPNGGYVCFLQVRHSWQWYIDRTTRDKGMVYDWFDRQDGVARVYRVERGQVVLVMAR